MEKHAATLFDTHVHLDAPPLFRDLALQIDRARKCLVQGFLLPGIRPEGWPNLLAIADATVGALAAPGIHPGFAAAWNEEAETELAKLLVHPGVVAVGEIGLDGLLPSPSMAVQEVAFRGQLRLAAAAELPVLIHCRRATGRIFDILKEERAGKVGGILHAFSGSLETAHRAIDLGFVLGIGGPLTYPNARRLPEVLNQIPAEAIVLETDAPDLPPHPHRGETNRPEYLVLVARKVAEIRGWSLQETARITTTNARRILKIGD